MHPRLLGARDDLDRGRLADLFARTLPGAHVWRDSFLGGSVLMIANFGGFSITLEAGKSNGRRGPRAPWMTATINFATHGFEADWMREFNARAFQVPVVREGEFIGSGGPSEIVAATFDPDVRAALGALGCRVEIYEGRAVLHLRGWPADEASLWLVVQTAHAIASRASQSIHAFLASGRAMDCEASLVAYRAGLRRSERIGKLILVAVFGVCIPAVMLITALW